MIISGQSRLVHQGEQSDQQTYCCDRSHLLSLKGWRLNYTELLGSKHILPGGGCYKTIIHPKDVVTTSKVTNVITMQYSPYHYTLSQSHDTNIWYWKTKYYKQIHIVMKNAMKVSLYEYYLLIGHTRHVWMRYMLPCFEMIKGKVNMSQEPASEYKQ